MSRLFKTVVLYLSMLTLPAQGFAASTMLHCGPAHQHTVTGQETNQYPAHGHANNLAADHRYQLQATVSLDSIGLASSDEAVSPASSDRGPAKAGELAAHESSEYAACCALTAVTASSLRFPPANQAIEGIASKQFPSICFVTDGPTRPPRSFPA